MEKEIKFTKPEDHEAEKPERDPIALFFDSYMREGKKFAEIKASQTDVSYLTPVERAESLWALFQEAKGLMVGRKKGGDAVLKQAVLPLLKQFYNDKDTKGAFAENYQRHVFEINRLNGDKEKYGALAKRREGLESLSDASARGLFSKRGEGVPESGVLIFEAVKKDLAKTNDELSRLLETNPELSAEAQYETLKEYYRELQGQNFIWTSSRKRLLREIETAAFSGKPVLLAGESGSGKTRLVEQSALVLTGRLNSQTPGKDIRFQDLIAKPKIASDGSTYYEYKEIGEAATGKKKHA